MDVTFNALQPNYSLASTYQDFKAFIINYNILTSIIAVTIGIMSRGVIASLINDIIMPVLYIIFFRHVNILQITFASLSKFQFGNFSKELLTFIISIVIAYSLIDNIFRRTILNIPDKPVITVPVVTTTTKPTTTSTTLKPITPTTTAKSI